MTRKRIVTIISIVAVAILLIKGRSLLKERQEQVASQPTPAADAVSVPVVKGVSGEMVRKVRYLAQVEGDKSITLSTKLAGYVKEVRVEESQRVHKGDLLVRIDETEILSSIHALQSTLAAQQGDLALARSIYARNQKLYRIGGLSKEQLESSRIAVEMKASALKTTRSKVEQLKHQLSYLSITAPFDGTIDKVILHEGDLAAAGKPIVHMSNDKQKLLFSFAPGKEGVFQGQIVMREDKPIGKIRAIYPVSTNGLVTAEAALDAPTGLPTGSSLSIAVLTARAKGCVLPDTTVMHTPEGVFAMVYEKERFHPIKVKVLLHQENRVLLEQCPKGWIASASEVKLSTLPAYRNIELIKPKEGGSHE